MRRLFASLFFLGAFVTAAAADSPPVHLKGAIQSVSGPGSPLGFTMSGSSSPVAVKMTDKTRIASLETAQLADITQGMFVGTAALPQPDGTLKLHFAVENPSGVSAKALATILDRSLSGLPAAEIATITPDIVERIFRQNISMGKGMGLMAMVNAVQALAKKAAA